MSHKSIIAIVDDDPSMRKLVSRYLERGGRESKSYENGEQFLADPDIARFDCVLLDLRMPGLDGISVIRKLRESNYLQPIIVVTGFGDVSVAVEAIKLGAVDFLEKPYTEESLSDALRDATLDGTTLAQRDSVADAVAKVASLSKRQREVLCGIVVGHQNKQIAFALGLSVRTIEAYRSELMEKIGVRSTAGVVRVATAANLDCKPYLGSQHS